MNRRSATLLAVLAIAAGLPAVAGCTPGQIDRLRESVGLARQSVADADAVIERLEADQAKLAQTIAAMPPGPDRQKAEKLADGMAKAIGEAKRYRDVTAERLAALEKSLATAADEIDVAEDLVQTVAPLLPPPWGAAAVMGAGLIASIWRGLKYRRDAETGRKVVSAIETVKADGKVDFGDRDTKAKLGAAMGADGKKLVDEIQGKA